MNILHVMRCVLVVLEFIEFLASPLGIGAILWLSLYTLLRDNASLSIWTAALLPFVVVIQWSMELNDQA